MSRPHLLALAFVLAASWVTTGARADGTAAECVAAAEQGQKLQGQGQLIEAKEKLLFCGRDSCPKVIRQDCTRWEGEVETALPSVVFGVKDEKGNDVTDVSVSIDGVPTLTELTGTATPIDPGSHRFVFKREGSPPLRTTALIRVGEKNRLVTARWGSAKTEAAGDNGSTPETPRGPRPVLGYVLLGVGAVAAGLATYGFVGGLGSTSSLRSGCGDSLGGCSPGQINSAQAQLWLGDIAAPVAGIAIAVGAYLLLRTPDAPAAKALNAGVTVGMQPGGGFVGWRRAF